MSGSSACTAASLAPIDDAAAPHLLQLAHGRLRASAASRSSRWRTRAAAARPRSACRCATDRSNSRSPSSSSSRRIAWLTAGWVRCSFLAACEKLRSAATVDEMRSNPAVARTDHKLALYKVKEV